MSRGSVVSQMEDIARFVGKAKAFLAKTPGGEQLAREADDMARKIPDMVSDVKRHWQKGE